VPVVVVTVTQGQQAAWRKRHFHSNKRSPSICFPTKNLHFSKIPRYQNSWWNGKNMHWGYNFTEFTDNHELPMRNKWHMGQWIVFKMF